MGILYREPAANTQELRTRADDLLTGRYHSPSEVRNNVEMTINTLAHTMLLLAEVLDRIEELEKKA